MARTRKIFTIAALKARLKKLLQKGDCKQYSTPLLEEQFTAFGPFQSRQPASATDKAVARYGSFLLDPLLCQVIMTSQTKGQTSQLLYPLLPDKAECVSRGFTLDPVKLRAATRRLLYAGDVQLPKDCFQVGEGGKVCFSVDVHRALLAKLDAPLVSMITEFLTRGFELEQERRHTPPSDQTMGFLSQPSCSILSQATSAVLDQLETFARDGLQTGDPGAPVLLLQLRRLRESLETDVAQNPDLIAAREELQATKRLVWRWEKRGKPLKDGAIRHRMPDGTMATAFSVENLVFDPTVDRESDEKRKRLPFFCCKTLILAIQGNKEPRPGGGTQWTLAAKLNEFLHWQRVGIEASRATAILREMDLNNQTLQSWAVPVPRSGCTKRTKLLTYKQREAKQKYNGFRLLDRPCPRTTHESIIPAFLNMFGLWAVDALRDPSTVQVGLSGDGCHAKGFGMLGTFFTVFQRTMHFMDPLGNFQNQTRCLRFPAPMTLSSNKLVKTLKNKYGDAFPPEAAYGLAKALYAGNFAGWLLENQHLLNLCLDGASDNTGCGSAIENSERLCGKNSIMEQLVLDRTVWASVIKDAEKSGLKRPHDSFYGNDKYDWDAQWGSEKLAPASTTLKTNGPVFKDREVVKLLEAYQEAETELRRNQERAVRVLQMAARTWMGMKRQREEEVPDERAAKFRKVKPDRDPAAHHKKFLHLLTASRLKAWRLYKERAADSQRGPHGRGRPVSMLRNPLRFLPCRRRRDGRLIGLANHCALHRLNTWTEDLMKPCNAGLLEQGVSLTKFCKCQYYFPDLSAAIEHLFCPEKELIDNDLDFVVQVRKVLELAKIDLTALQQRCNYDVKKGLRAPVSAAPTRWGTSLGAQTYSFESHPLLAYAMIKFWSRGPVHVRVKAAVSVLSSQGFNSADFGQLMLEDCVKRHFAYLTTVSDILQMATANVVNCVVSRLLLAAFSARYECGEQGLEAKIRAILMVLRRDIWVHCFPFRGWGLGLNRRMAIGCRTHGAECEPGPCVVLLRSQAGCRAAVRSRLGDWPGMDKLVDAAVEAVPVFVDTVKMLANRTGEMLPEDSRRAYDEMLAKSHSAMKAGPDFNEGRNSHAGRVSQAYWLLRQVCQNNIDRIVKGGQRELFAVYGWVAAMGKTCLTEEIAFRSPDGVVSTSRVVVADKFAVPNAVSTLVAARDLGAHYAEQGIDGDALMMHLPSWASVLGPEARPQLVAFGGFNTTLGVGTANAQMSFKEWDMRRCHAPDAAGPQVVTTTATSVAAAEGAPVDEPDTPDVGADGVSPAAAAAPRLLQRTWRPRRCQGVCRANCRACFREEQQAAVGAVDLKAYERFERPLCCYDKLFPASEAAGHVLATSKGVEGHFSSVTVIGRSKCGPKFRHLDQIARKKCFKTSGRDPADVVLHEEKFRDAESLAGETGWSWVWTRDKVKADQMHEANMLTGKMCPQYVQRGARFRKTNHGISSRTRKYRKVAEAAGQEQPIPVIPAKTRMTKRARPIDEDLEAQELRKSLAKKARAVAAQARRKAAEAAASSGAAARRAAAARPRGGTGAPRPAAAAAVRARRGRRVSAAADDVGDASDAQVARYADESALAPAPADADEATDSVGDDAGDGRGDGAVGDDGPASATEENAAAGGHGTGGALADPASVSSPDAARESDGAAKRAGAAKESLGAERHRGGRGGGGKGAEERRTRTPSRRRA